MSAKERRRANAFSRRSLLLGGAQALVFAGLGYRLYDLQLAQGNDFRLASEKNRITSRLLIPPRGIIVDRFGELLAYNVPSYDVYLTADATQDFQKSLSRLVQALNLSAETVSHIKEKIGVKRHFVPILVASGLSTNQAAIIETRLPELPGVEVRIAGLRFYPKYDALAHIVGYVSAVTPQDLKNDSDPTLRQPNFKIGRTGAESMLDISLRGKPGVTQLEINAHGRSVRKLRTESAQEGALSALTINWKLQNLAYNQLKKIKSGAIILMDARTGEILVSASYPSYDPNLFVQGLSEEKWNSILNDDLAPLRNKALAGEYPPGSTFKMVTMLAALDAGVPLNFNVQCQGHKDIGNQRFHCWKKQGHGLLGMHDALVESCDVWYYDVAQRIGIERIITMARRLGFGRKLSLDLDQENRGTLPGRMWKRNNKLGPWTKGDTVQVAIGQGYLSATLLQLATMTSRIASGFNVTPYYVYRKKISPPGKLSIQESHLEHVRKAMFDVVNADNGTARGAAINDLRITFSGKTGTAQVRRISLEERAQGVLSNEEIEWRQRDHALFCGFTPYESPKYAAAVIVEHGASGAAAAAPLAANILTAAQLSIEPNIAVTPNLKPEKAGTARLRTSQARPAAPKKESLFRGHLFNF